PLHLSRRAPNAGRRSRSDRGGMSNAKRSLDLSLPLARYAAALVTVAATTIVLIVLRGQTNPTTVSLALVLVILIAAIGLGRGPALASALAGALSLNFFFLPPYYTLTVDEPQNWVA